MLHFRRRETAHDRCNHEIKIVPSFLRFYPCLPLFAVMARMVSKAFNKPYVAF
jgi:hypothetical protein